MTAAASAVSRGVTSDEGYGARLTQALSVGDPHAALLSESNGRTLTRNDVRERVDELAAELTRAGCGVEKLVAIKLDPGVDAIIAIFAVLATGAAYLPLDPRHGDVRTGQILDATTPDALLTSEGINWVGTTSAQMASNGLADLGYVISTSGSTGKPKAAMLEQRGLVVHTDAMIELFDLDSDDVVLQTAPPSFDICVWQCTTPVIAGTRTHVASAEERLDPRALWRVIQDEKVTVTQLVPSMIRVLLDCAPSVDSLSLRHVISTGEALDPELANRWFTVYPDLPLINMYGPAECSDDVAVHILDGPVDPSTPVPIGKGFAGAHLRLIDEAGNQARPGETAELQVCGDVVGRGYRNDPERTAAVFGTVEIDGQMVRSYNTGDLAFFDGDGLLRYVGRKDFQVKVRGNRVELGEIESVIAGHPAIRACVVTKFDDNTDRLVAHVETGGTPIDRAELRSLVADTLPSYMCPSAFVTHETLPLNPNGKVDRKSLPAPTADDLVASNLNGLAATSQTEKALAASWGELLDLDQVPVDADFFDLGGTSLLAVMCIDDLENNHGIGLTPNALIMGGTIQNIALTIDAGPANNLADPHSTGLTTLQRHSDTSGLPPLFLYPGEAVSALGMVELGRGIDSTRSVHVFEPARPLDGEPGPGMSELARRCIEAISKVQPDGTIHLGGFCMGGDVCWEIANQLEAAGRPVASVLLLQTERDGTYPSYPDSVQPVQRMRANLGQRVRFERATIDALGPAQRRSHVRHLIIGKIISKFTLPIEQRLDRSGWRARFGLRRSLRLKQHQWALIDRAAYDGWQPSAIATPVAVLRASDQPPLANPDPSLGWHGIGRGPIETHEVEGFHWSFLHHPSVVELAQVVSDVMRRLDPAPKESHRDLA